jgi:hypothetical protein
MVLINCYLLALFNFRTQQDFRRQLVGALLAMGRDSDISPKRRTVELARENQVPVQCHGKVKMVEESV